MLDLPLTTGAAMTEAAQWRRLQMLLVVTASVAGMSCEPKATPSPELRAVTGAMAAPAGGKVLAVVNDVAITDGDVRQRMKGAAHGATQGNAAERGVLETLVREELARQRAVTLGFDRESDYLRKLAKLEAELEAFKRAELSATFVRKEITDKAKASEQQARQYFLRHERDVRSEFHVLQILYTRDSEAAQRALDAVRRGENFEAVAKRRFGDLPPSQRPWDLGYLRWNQLPDAWWDVIFDMKPGQVSNVISGPDGRYWVIKLVARRTNPEMSFAGAKPRIMAVLERQALQQRREEVFAQLTKTAKVIYTDAANGRH